MTTSESDPYAASLDGSWIKSSYSEGNGPDCVEIMRIAGGFAVRDSKNPDGPVLRFARDEMSRLHQCLLLTEVG